MTWKASLMKPVEKRDGNVVATVKFSSDAGESFVQEVMASDLTETSLAAFCQRVVLSREARDRSFDGLSAKQPGIIRLPRDAVV